MEKKGAMLRDWAQTGQEGQASRSDPTMGGPGATPGRGEPKDLVPSLPCDFSGTLAWRGADGSQGHKHQEEARAIKGIVRRPRKNSQLKRFSNNPHCHCSSVPVPSPHPIQTTRFQTNPHMSPCSSGWKPRNRGQVVPQRCHWSPSRRGKINCKKTLEEISLPRFGERYKLIYSGGSPNPQRIRSLETMPRHIING